MKYDFDTVTDRFGTASVKWMGGKDVLPMWVADMDFQSAPEIKEAVVRRAEHGIFGYTLATGEWKDAVCGWWKTRYSYDIDPAWVLFSSGVIPVVSCAIRILSEPGDNIAVMSPVYDHFFIAIESNGRTALESQLLYDGSNYSIDYDDLEEKLKVSKAIILCNPHNPIGKLWDRDELERIGELCKKRGVVVIADEIHCDLTEPGKKYIPFASVSDAPCVMCVAPTKSFNIAGLHTAAAVVKDEGMRKAILKELMRTDSCSANAFSIDAATAAYTKGGEWLDELREYISENRKTVEDYVCKYIPDLKVVHGEATYLLWLDCRKFTGNSAKLSADIRKNNGLWLSPGNQYRGDGDLFLRMNIACPKQLLMEGLERLRSALEDHTEYYDE